jgi:hypothetical protein
VDTRYIFVRENLEDRIIKIKFVTSAENDSNIFTKNVSQEIYERHMNFFKKRAVGNSEFERFDVGRVLESYPSRSNCLVFIC